MADRVWEQFLTENDRALISKTPTKPRVGFGNKAAVLSIDNYRAAVGDRSEPLLDAIGRWPRSAGPSAWTALVRVQELFSEARLAGIEVIHATGLAEYESGMLGWRAFRNGKRQVRTGPDMAELDEFDFVDQALPLPGEVIIKKNSPSAFFGTPLASHLMSRRIDTLIVCGEAVSGCVRATVVDGCSYRLRMIVVEDCVYDRHEASMAMNLFDIDQKYGDVLSWALVRKWIQEIGGEHTVE